MTRRTLRRQPRPAIRGRSETAIHKHATDSNAPGRGHGCIQPFLWCPETAVTHATSYLCGARWCGVGALRERRRAITALGRHIESNESNQRIRSARTAVSTCQTVYLQHIQIYQCFTTLQFTVLMFIGFGKIKQTQQIVRSGSLSSSLPTRSMAATSSACVTAVQNASYLRSRSYEEKSEHLQI